MKKKLFTVLLAASMMAGTGLGTSFPVMAAQTTASAAASDRTAVSADGTEEISAAAASDTAATKDSTVKETHPGDLLEYLGTDSSTIQEMFVIARSNVTENTGSQLYADNGIVFQTDAQGKVDFINMYQASDFSIRGVRVGMDNPTVRAFFTQYGWTEHILSTSLGDLWTFVSPDGQYSSTVITDADGIVLCVAVTQLGTTDTAAETQTAEAEAAEAAETVAEA